MEPPLIIEDSVEQIIRESVVGTAGNKLRSGHADVAFAIDMADHPRVGDAADPPMPLR